MLQILRALGVNRAVGYGVLTRIWGVFAGVFTIVIIASSFSQEQQGFFYAIGSLLAMQMFFELGLTTMISTFASHEFIKLNWAEKGKVEGDQVALQRFEDLLCKSVQWFGIASLIMIAALIPAGFIFLGNGGDTGVNFSWQLPWVLAVIGTALNLLVVPFFSVIMGSGDVVTVNHRGMVGGIIGSLISWTVIGFGGGLYAVSAVALGNIIVSWSYLIAAKPELLKMAYKGVFGKRERPSRISWRYEIWPLQWKMAVTWVSGYFIFQLFTPVLFYYHGAVIAGQMGMTLSVINALLAISVVWVNAKLPAFGKLIALRDWDALDRIFFHVFYQSIMVSILGAVVAWFCVWLLQGSFQIGDRFLPSSQLALLLMSTIVLIVTSGFATYLRAHKQEPLMMITVMTAILQTVSVLVLGMRYSSFGVVLGYFLIVLFFAMPATYLIWKNRRKKWHPV